MWRTRIDEFLNSSQTSNSLHCGLSDEFVVRVDKRTPSPPTAVHSDHVMWPSSESDVMVSGERFGISHADLTAISDKMNYALERVEQMSRADDVHESFDEIMNVIEERISLLYEEYDRLIGSSSTDDESRMMDNIDSEVGFFVPPSTASVMKLSILSRRKLKNPAPLSNRRLTTY